MTQTDEGDRPARPIAGRRALLAAGLSGAVLAIAGGARTAGAQTGLDADPDTALLEFAMRVELTARDLYDAAVADGALTDVASAMREQHEAYAQSLAAETGISASGRYDGVYDALVGAFTGSDADVAAAAYDLESVAVATHTDLVGRLADPAAAGLIASILIVEARHCAVLADVAGRGDDLDALLVIDADALTPEDIS